jgi:hypothetical protein
MPLMSNLVLNDGTVDVTFEPAFRENGASVFEADASGTDRPRFTGIVSKIATNATKRKERVVSRMPYVLSELTGETAYIVIGTEVVSDQRIPSTEVAKALTIHRNGLAHASVEEMIVDHRIFYG